MIKINPENSSIVEIYRVMIGGIIPRPIAWVSSRSKDGVDNLAPFSAFNLVTSSPATLLFTAINDKNGRVKDTVKNIKENPHFVVNSVSYSQVKEMDISANNFNSAISEFSEANLTPVEGTTVNAPMVEESKIRFECDLHDIYNVGEGPLAANVIFGKIKLIHVDSDILDEKGHVIPERLDVIGRLGRSYNIRVDRTD